MSQPKIAAYFSAWDVIANGLDYATPLRAALAVFDEVIVAVNTSKDDTAARIHAIGEEPENAGRLWVVETAFRYDDITFDGAVKNAALQGCTQGPEWLYVQLDLDELVLVSQHQLWRDYAAQLAAMPGVDCFMLPSVDLWGSIDTIRADKNVGLKFRLHKGGLKRGVWNGGWKDGRTHLDTSKSDSTELTTMDGELVRCYRPVPPVFLSPSMTAALNGYPLVLHLGYVDYEQRVRVNKAIWAEHWQLRSGHPEAVAVDKAALEHYPLIKHQIKLT